MKRKNEKYLSFIRKKPCCVCSNPESEPHHIRQKLFVPPKYRGGIGLKPFDFMTVPLCRSCHTKVHQGMALENPHYIIIDMLCQYITEVENGPK
jgi:hypothetical protein